VLGWHVQIGHFLQACVSCCEGFLTITSFTVGIVFPFNNFSHAEDYKPTAGILNMQVEFFAKADIKNNLFFRERLYYAKTAD
jgi:hypothetical protein